MPRRGWQALDTPSGWYEVIRGPRPRSVQWPLAKPVQVRQSQVTPGRQRRWEWGGSSRTRGPPQQSSVPRLDPDERCAAAQTKVQSLEAALAAFGEEDSPEMDVLKDFLARAVEQAKVKPVDVRIKSCESYLQRCTKQLEEAKAFVMNCEEEVAKTQARLARLKMEADLQPPEPRARQEDVESEVIPLRKQVSELQQKFRPPHPVLRDPRRRTRI